MKNDHNTRKADVIYNILASILVYSFFFTLTACSDPGRKTDKLKIYGVKIPKEASLSDLSKKRIFLLHRSVQSNILQGIEDIMAQYPGIHIQILQHQGVTSPQNNGIILSWIDQGQSPQSIAERYTRLVKKIPGKDIDFALLRFTPWYGKKNMDEKIKDYNTAIQELKQRHPKTTFIHSTFSLQHSKTSLKTWLKKIFGKKEIWEYDGNIEVNKFNELLRKHYLNKEPFFDIATIESTYPDGKRSMFTKDGKKYFHLAKQYTYDGTHLNQKGRQMAAAELLNLLSELNQR